MSKPEREEGRRKRVPMGGRRAKLQLSDEDTQNFKDNGWTVRWISDIDGRIQQAQAGSWEFCTRDEAPSIGQFNVTKGSKALNDRVSMTVSKGGGEPITGYLMKILTEYYVEDQAAKEKANKAFDDALNSGQPGGNVVENQYVPQGHVNRV